MRPVDRDRRAVVRLEVVAELLRRANARPQPAPRRRTSVTRSPNSPRTCSSSPHSGGGCAPGGGGGAYGFMVANICPMKPSGVQLSSPIVPARAGTTRTSSSAPAWWCGANITPTQEMTASNDAVGVRQRLGVGLLPVDRRPRPPRPAPARSQSSGVRSLATTSAPAGRPGSRRCPCPRRRRAPGRRGRCRWPRPGPGRAAGSPRGATAG